MFLGKRFFEFSDLMKAEDLFTWHYRNFALFLKYQKTVFFIHPSLFLYSSALPNERMKAPFRFLPSFGSSEIGGFLYVCLLGRLACHSFFTIFGEPVYIYIEREDFLKRMKTSFIYIQSCTYYIGVVCEASVSFHAQCL